MPIRCLVWYPPTSDHICLHRFRRWRRAGVCRRDHLGRARRLLSGVVVVVSPRCGVDVSDNRTPASSAMYGVMCRRLSRFYRDGVEVSRQGSSTDCVSCATGGQLLSYSVRSRHSRRRYRLLRRKTLEQIGRQGSLKKQLGISLSDMCGLRTPGFLFREKMLECTEVFSATLWAGHCSSSIFYN